MIVGVSISVEINEEDGEKGCGCCDTEGEEEFGGIVDIDSYSLICYCIFRHFSLVFQCGERVKENGGQVQ